MAEEKLTALKTHEIKGVMKKPTEKASEVIHVLRRRERRHLSDRVKVQQTCNYMKGIDWRQELTPERT